MKYIITTLLFLAISTTYAGYTQNGNTLTFTDPWWQVERAWPATGRVCSGGSGESCTLEPGDYKWIGTTAPPAGVLFTIQDAAPTTGFFIQNTSCLPNVTSCSAGCRSNAIAGSCSITNTTAVNVISKTRGKQHTCTTSKRVAKIEVQATCQNN